MPSVEDRDQTDRVTTPTRTALWTWPRYAARFVALARSADDVTIWKPTTSTMYCVHHSVLC